MGSYKIHKIHHTAKGTNVYLPAIDCCRVQRSTRLRNYRQHDIRLSGFPGLCLIQLARQFDVAGMASGVLDNVDDAPADRLAVM